MGCIGQKEMMEAIDLLVRVNEEPIGSIFKKQRSVTRLFPSFVNRVNAIRNRGGIRLVEDAPGLWHFQVVSGTQDGVKYDVYIRFADIRDQIMKQVQDMRLWKQDKSGVDLRKLGSRLMDVCDLKVKCTCPAFLYWGFKYITTKRDTVYGEPEQRRPKIRNPKEYGIVCKHLQLVLNQLGYYTTTLGNHVKKYFKKDLERAEDLVRQKLSGVKKGAEFLKRRLENV